jgi:hypothetical protein
VSFEPKINSQRAPELRSSLRHFDLGGKDMGQGGRRSVSAECRGRAVRTHHAARHIVESDSQNERLRNGRSGARHVRFTSHSDQIGAGRRTDAMCHLRTYAPQRTYPGCNPLFDHVIGTHQNSVRKADPELFGRFHVDGKL